MQQTYYQSNFSILGHQQKTRMHCNTFFCNFCGAKTTKEMNNVMMKTNCNGISNYCGGIKEGRNSRS